MGMGFLNSLNTLGLQQCNQCDLCGVNYGLAGFPPVIDRPTQKVDGRGDIPCRIFLLGEGPGREEDKTGHSFVGESGQFLQSLIEEYRLPPTRIGNVVRCRPPGNRKPTVAEMQSCAGWLHTELGMAEPDVIVALGATAISWFLPGMKMKGNVGKYVGEIVGYYRGVPMKQIPVLGSYHPAARDPAQRNRIGEVFQKALEMLGIETPTPKLVDYGVEYW